MLLAGGVEPMRGDQLLPGEKRLGRECGAATLSFLPSAVGLRYKRLNRTDWNEIGTEIGKEEKRGESLR